MTYQKSCEALWQVLQNIIVCVFILGCLNKCSGKGLCDNATCSCLDGWSGEDCSVGKCGNCSRGNCEGGFCQCEISWEGSACDQEATCYGVDNCTSPLHGNCLTTDKCLCNGGYIGKFSNSLNPWLSTKRCVSVYNFSLFISNYVPHDRS